jgi:hypothetical protein
MFSDSQDWGDCSRTGPFRDRLKPLSISIESSNIRTPIRSPPMAYSHPSQSLAHFRLFNDHRFPRYALDRSVISALLNPESISP